MFLRFIDKPLQMNFITNILQIYCKIIVLFGNKKIIQIIQNLVNHWRKIVDTYLIFNVFSKISLDIILLKFTL